MRYHLGQCMLCLVQVSEFPCCEVREYSCGRRCGRSLACGNHLCERGCHVIINPPGDGEVNVTSNPFVPCLHELSVPCYTLSFHTTNNLHSIPLRPPFCTRLGRTASSARENVRSQDPLAAHTPALSPATKVGGATSPDHDMWAELPDLIMS